MGQVTETSIDLFICDMRKLLLLFAAALLVVSCGTAGMVNKADQKWSYELESAGVGTDGTYAVKVWSYSRKPQISTEVSKVNAVHGVIFKGVPAGKGATVQPPLVPSADAGQQNAAFFDNFFAHDYRQFINQVVPGSTQTLKTGKNEYKIGVIVSVAKDRLRSFLEQKGIIKGLSTGF